MKDRKRTLRARELWNRGAMEPGIYRVRLRPQRPETPEARRERGEICREMGWDCTAVITGDDDYDCEV